MSDSNAFETLAGPDAGPHARGDGILIGAFDPEVAHVP